MSDGIRVVTWGRELFRSLRVLDPDRAAMLLLAAVAAIWIFTVADYGVTWDEDVHAYYGNLVVEYYASGFTDLRALSWWNLYLYGAAFDAFADVLARVSPLGLYETRHALNITVGLIGLIGTWKLARAVGGPRVAFWALLFIAVAPTYYGHSFNNPKDVPFAAGMIWATYYAVRIVQGMPKPAWRDVLLFGLATGLATGVRVGGFIVFGYLALGVGLWVLFHAIAERSIRTFLLGAVDSIWRIALPALVVIYPVMLAGWPWAQQDPLLHPYLALTEFSHHTYPWKTLFAGGYYDADQLPWIYLPTHLLLKVPELVGALFFGALALALFVFGRSMTTGQGGRFERMARFLPALLIGFAAIFPVVYAIAVRVTLFDGMRHFLFVMPPICIVAGYGFQHLIEWLKPKPWRAAVFASLALYGAWHASMLARLHPNEYVYYNALIGGTDGAEGLFKLDYWGNSYAEAVRGLTDKLRSDYGDEFEARNFKVRICGPKAPASYYFPPNFEVTSENDQADFVISMSAYAPAGIKTPESECDTALAGREIYRVERLEALMSLVIDRRDIKLASARAQVQADARRRIRASILP